MKILVTGFEPFNNARINPSQILADSLPKELNGAEIIGLSSVPVVFIEAGNYVLEAIREHKPDAVLSLGQAGGINAVSIERVAVNLMDASIKDNAGKQPVDEKIFEDGENAYFSSLPIKAMCKRIREIGINALISNSAGLYVCNSLMYSNLYHASRNFKGMLAGFMHVPYLNEQVLGLNQPSISLDEASKALNAALLAIIDEIKGKTD